MPRSRPHWLLLPSAGLCLALVLGTTAQADPGDNGAQSVVILELFTSQGCSSCPPADALLRDVKEKWGARVVPLAFHVDYWTYLGWHDPFSSADWTERQERYAAMSSERRIYTPQLIVAGGERLVGSRRAKVVGSVERALAKNAAVPIGFSGRFESDALTACIFNHAAPGPADQLYLAIFEDDLVTQVTRGENAGRTLRNDFVVRKLTRIDPAAGRQLQIPIRPEWSVKSLGAVVFWQNGADGRIRGAAELDAAGDDRC